MKKSEIISRLRLLIADMEQPEQSAEALGASAPRQPKQPDGPDNWQRGFCNHWSVKQTANGKTMGSLGIKDAPGFYKIFDEKILEKFDPVRKGQELEYVLKPWNDTFTVHKMRLVGTVPMGASKASHGIDADEIPF